jgi:hypothetical protein
MMVLCTKPLGPRFRGDERVVVQIDSNETCSSRAARLANPGRILLTLG